ncbi:MAG: R2-like ligand-binding oxidase [Ktedonobacteraceae bacterium]|nr:R2-like ligand-binding oxidase [Chloroflexota bacterium]
MPARQGGVYTTLSRRGLRHDIPPMRLYHKAKQLGIWDPRSIDLTQDRVDWERFPQEQKEGLRRLIVAFQAGEEAVTLDLLPLILTIAREGRLEEEMFLTTFLWEEAKHTEFFRRFLDEVMQEQGEDLHQYRTLGSGGRDLFSEDLSEVMNALLSDPSPAAQVRASVLYNMYIEGVLAEAGYYRFSYFLDRANVMPGLKQGIGYIKRDESRHIAYGVFLISRLVAQDPTLWPQVEEQMNALYARSQASAAAGPQTEEERYFAKITKMQFDKRLASIERARRKTVEQVYQMAESEETEGA